jgi:hypothetical protein
VTSQVALAPITAENLKALRTKPAFLDEPSIPGPYKLASAPSLPALDIARGRGRAAGAITIGYRHGFGKLQKLFRWLNESAYLVSTPFIMILLLGLVTRNHSVLVFGATVVVLLNIGRIVAGVANLAAMAFRDSPVQGVLFLIPPLTFIYLAQNWQKVHRPVKRVTGPIITISLVILAFVIESRLEAGAKGKGSVRDQVRAGTASFKEAIGGQLEKATNLKVDDLNKLVPKASDTLKSLENSETLKSLEKKVEESGLIPGAEKQGSAGGATNSPR